MPPSVGILAYLHCRQNPVSVYCINRQYAEVFIPCPLLSSAQSLGLGLPLRLYSSKVSAGFRSPAQDHLEREISLMRFCRFRAPHTYLVRAGGDSMIRAGIHDGDLMVVDRSREAEPGRS